MTVIQYSVISRRRGSRDRDKRPEGPRPLLLLALVRLLDGQFTVLGLLTDRKRGLWYA